MAELARLEQLGLDLAGLTDAEIAAVADGLNAAAAEELRDGRPRNTQVAYAEDFAEWTRFCRENGLPPELDERLLRLGLPSLLQSFVNWMTKVGVQARRRGEGVVSKPPAPSTMRRRVLGTAWTLRDMYGVDVVPRGVTGNALARIRQYQKDMAIGRKKIDRGDAAIAIPLDELRRVALACDTDTLIGLRNRTMLVLWVYAGWRVSEIAARTVGDVVDTGKMLRVRADWSKSGSKIARIANKPDSILNPVRLWRDWLAASAHATPAGATTDRPAFPPIDRHGNIAARHISREKLRKALIGMFEQAGSDLTVTAHSIRHSTVTELIENQAPRHLVEEQVGFSNGSRTLGVYVDAIGLDARNASHYMQL